MATSCSGPLTMRSFGFPNFSATGPASRIPLLASPATRFHPSCSVFSWLLRFPPPYAAMGACSFSSLLSPSLLLRRALRATVLVLFFPFSPPTFCALKIPSGHLASATASRLGLLVSHHNCINSHFFPLPLFIFFGFLACTLFSDVHGLGLPPCLAAQTFSFPLLFSGSLPPIIPHFPTLPCCSSVSAVPRFLFPSGSPLPSPF